MLRLGAYRLPNRCIVEGADVHEFVHRTGIALPCEYQQFVSIWGMSTFRDYVTFPIGGNPPFGDEGLIGVFYGLGQHDSYALADAIQRYHNRLPLGFIPVAEDPGSNLICLNLGQSGFGRVWFWDKESEGSSGQRWPVAESWDHFMSLLRPWVPPE